MPTRNTIGLVVGLSVLSAVPALHAEQIAMRRGQAVMLNDWGGPIGEDYDATRAEGFSVAAGTTDLADTEVPALFAAMDEGDWLKAIRLLETLGETENEELIRDPSGMLRPLSTLRTQVIAELPDEGRRTFRTMYDPIARKLLEDSEAIDDPRTQLVMLTGLIDDYALCEAAVAAADRLGDLQYERGRFGEAARYYNFAAEHAEGDVDDAALMSKRLHAYARGGDWAQFDELAEYARFRRGEVPIRLGGEDRSMNDIIDALLEARPDGSDRPMGGLTTIDFPRGAYPAAELTLVDERTIARISQATANRGVSLMTEDITRANVAEADGRLYVIALGEVSAHVPGSDETLWAHGNTEEFVERLANQSHQITQGYYQSLAVHDDLLITTSHDTNRLELVRLRAHDKATGEAVWDTAHQGGEYANHSYIGEPVERDGTLYAVAQDRRNNNRLTLVTFGLRDGDAQWSVDLGQPPIDPNWGQPMGLAPRIAVGGQYVMVLTNDGALIAIDPVRHEIVWAMSYRILHSAAQRGMPPTYGEPGDVAVVDGVVYSKDMRDDRLHAIRESDAVRLWSIEVDAKATLVHTDSRHAYLLGDELVAIDLKTGERVWWTSHHGRAGRQPAFTDTHALIAGPNRMCRIDLTTGKIDGYREDISAGSTGSPTVLLDRGVAVIGPTGLRIYDTESETQD